MQIYVQDMNQADLQLFGTCSQSARRCPNLLAQLRAPAGVLSSAGAVAPGSALCCQGQRWHGELEGCSTQTRGCACTLRCDGSYHQNCFLLPFPMDLG